MSGNNDGSLNGAKWSKGVEGKALEFDGEDDYVRVNNTITLEKESATLVWSMNPYNTSSTGLFTDDPTNLDNHIEVRSNKIFAETQTNCNYFDFGQYEKKNGWKPCLSEQEQ